jgi:hypothetical protein
MTRLFWCHISVMSGKLGKKRHLYCPNSESDMAEKISKQEAVRRALAHFGNDAKPAEMKAWIKDELGIEMGADHISTAKGSILKAAGKRKAKKAGPKSLADKPAAKQPPAATKSGIPLQDILYVKGLVGRFGREQLHTLINAFAG